MPFSVITATGKEPAPKEQKGKDPREETTSAQTRKKIHGLRAYIVTKCLQVDGGLLLKIHLNLGQEPSSAGLV
jgi:hypothetical protein